MELTRKDFLGFGGTFLAVGGLAAGGLGTGGCRRADAGEIDYCAQIPVFGDYDICVIGAGPGGIGAAVAAARAGKRVCLVEHYGYPGGVGTNCATPTFFRFADDERQFIGGIADEVVRRLGRRNAAWFLTRDGRYQPDYDNPVRDQPLTWRVRSRVEDMRVAYHDLLDEAGVDKLFYAHLCGTARDGRRLTAAIVDCREGPRAIRARIFVDATGAAHLVHRAGARTVLAPPEKTMHKSVWAHVADCDITPEVMAENRKTYDNLYRKHRERLPANVWASLDGMGVSVGYVNGNSCDSKDMTRMDAEMRRRNFEVLAAFKRELKGFDRAYIDSAIHQVGSRSGRHIVGRECLTADVVLADRPPANSVMPIYRYWGAHAASMDEGFRGGNAGERAGLGGLPYGTLVSADLDNVFACGLNLAVEEDYVETIRMMPSCFATGEVAGTAASLALDRSLADVGAVPHAELVKALEKNNFIVG